MINFHLIDCIEFMKDNTVAVFETNSRKVKNKSTIYDLMDEAYLVPEFEKTFAYYYAFEDKIFIQLDSNSVGSKVIHFIDRYTLNFSSPGGQKTKDCEVVEYSIGKIFNETKIKSEYYFEEIKNKIQSELSEDRKI